MMKIVSKCIQNRPECEQERPITATSTLITERTFNTHILWESSSMSLLNYLWFVYSFRSATETPLLHVAELPITCKADLGRSAG